MAGQVRRAGPRGAAWRPPENLALLRKAWWSRNSGERPVVNFRPESAVGPEIWAAEKCLRKPPNIFTCSYV